MRKPKIGRWPKVGSIIEFVTYKGLAYAQVTHLDPDPLGNLIRIFKGFYDERPQEFSELAIQPHNYYTFIHLNTAIHGKFCHLVAHEAVPSFAQCMPHFRGMKRGDDRWWIECFGNGEDYIAGPLTDEEKHYPLYALPSPDLIISRIEKGWSPYWQNQLEIGKVKCDIDPFFYDQLGKPYGTPPAHTPFSSKPDFLLKVNTSPYFRTIRVRGRHAPYYTVRLEDRDSGVFFEAYSKAGKLDVMHIYDLNTLPKDKKTFEFFWSDDGQKAALTIDGICHAVYDFENKNGYCRSQFPKPIESSPFSRPAWSDECLKPFL